MGFNFGKNTVELEISGQKFEANPYKPGFVAEAQEYHKALAELSNAGNDTPESINALCEASSKLVDSLLGKGACARIMKGREPNYLDYQELTSYLLGAVMAFRSKRVKEATLSGVEAANHILGQAEQAQ